MAFDVWRLLPCPTNGFASYIALLLLDKARHSLFIRHTVRVNYEAMKLLGGVTAIPYVK